MRRHFAALVLAAAASVGGTAGGPRHTEEEVAKALWGLPHKWSRINHRYAVLVSPKALETKFHPELRRWRVRADGLFAFYPPGGETTGRYACLYLDDADLRPVDIVMFKDDAAPDWSLCHE